MGYKEDDDELPEAPPIQMVTETFSEVTVTLSDTKNNKDDDKE